MAAAVLKKSGSSLTTDSPPFNPRMMVGGGNSPGAPVFRSNPFASDSDKEHALAHSNAIPKHTFEHEG
jgi:hypothetical protein